MKPIQQPNKSKFLCLLYASALLTPLVLVFLPRSTNIYSIYSWGQAMGLVSFTILAIQFTLSSRIKLIEHGVGLDRMLRLHRYNAYLLIITVLLHPLLLFWRQIIQFQLPRYTTGHYLGLLSMSLLLLIVITSVAGTKLKLSWQQWRLIHFCAYGVVFFGGIHSLLLGSHLSKGNPVYYWWLSLILMVFVTITHRLIRAFKHTSWLPIEAVISSGTNSTTLIFSKPYSFRYYPGQFTFVRIASQAVDQEEHHFTLSSSPTEKGLALTIKKLGDYTDKIAHVQKGDLIRLDGPYGIFSNVGYTNPNIFICGGVGITPIRAMLKYMHDTKQKLPTVLLYSAHTKDELLFFNEINYWSRRHPWFTVEYFLTQEKRRRYNFGRISDSKIRALVRKYPQANYWLSGSKSFTRGINQVLHNSHIPKKRIHVEYFNLK